MLSLETFLGSAELSTSPRKEARIRFSGLARRICLPDPLGGSVGDNRRPVRPILPRSPIADNEPAAVLEC